MKLYRHQQTMLSLMYLFSGFAIFAEAGCGKTIPMILHLLELLKKGKITNALIVAPKSALGSWKRDIEKLDQDDAVLITEAVDMVNYERVWRNDTYNKAYGCIVLDESHNIKNRNSRRSKFLLQLACQATYHYILTGTPIANGSLEDFWSQITFLNPYMSHGRVYGRIWKDAWEALDPEHEYKGSYQEFLDRYCLLNRYFKPYNYKRVEELQKIIDGMSYRITKAECLDLPEKLPDEIVECECAEKKTYKRLATQSALAEYDLIAENPLSRMTKLRQLCSGHIATDTGIIECRCEKITMLGELLDRYPENKKIVIFAEFKYSIQKIQELLQKKQKTYVVLDGQQKDKEIWRRFQNDETIQIIICQYKSGNAGIDLFASDTMIFYEPTLQSVVLEQARDRIHRQGQKSPCSYIHLITQGTIETEIYKKLEKFEDFSEKFFTQYIDNCIYTKE